MSIEQAENAIREGLDLFIQNKDEIAAIQKDIEWAHLKSQEVSQAELQEKPIKQLRLTICQMAQKLCKPRDISEILQRYRQSLSLRITVQSFLCNTIQENKLWIFEAYFKQGLDQQQIMGLTTEQPSSSSPLFYDNV